MAQTLKHESLLLAFNLILDIGEHSYGDVDYGAKTCGYGDTDEPFQAMDTALLEIIESRLGDCTDNECNDVAFVLSPTTDDMGTSQDELREALKPKGIRNKSQFLINDRARRGDQQLLMTRRSTRRMDKVDWAGNALNDRASTAGAWENITLRTASQSYLQSKALMYRGTTTTTSPWGSEVERIRRGRGKRELAACLLVYDFDRMY